MICSCCSSNTLLKLIDLGAQPYANKYPDQNSFKDEFIGNLSIYICSNCFSAKTESMAPRDKMFEEYFYLSSINKELVEHFKKLSLVFPDNSKILDIGSNDGILLKPLIESKRNINALGIDPSINVGEIANKNGLPTVIGFFDSENAKFIKEKYGEFDYLVASSIFTHVENSDEFIQNVKFLMKEKGTFILEIEYIKNILNGLEFERFYFDRPFYFSIQGIKYLFEKHNLYINKIEHISPHGGSLRFYICNTDNNSLSIEKSIKLEKEYFDNILSQNFHNKSQLEANKLRDFLINLKSNNKKVIGFGCPARFATITNFADISSDILPFVIDDSPIKQSKFTPGKHIPIVKRDFLYKFQPEIIIVFAYEYFESIFEFTAQFNAEHYKPIPLLKLNK